MAQKKKPTVKTAPKPVCGIVMPISATEHFPADHWEDVREILCESIAIAGFDHQLVSDADDIGIIQKRIIQNLYTNPVVVCDVSGKNPNVMFELGIRLAFDKPTVIVKDDKTSYSFDTAPIEHLEYPRDLRFGQIVSFKSELAEKIKGTHDKSSKDPSYTTFLKHFGSFAVAKFETKQGSRDEIVLDELQNLKRLIIETQDFAQRSRTRAPRPYRYQIAGSGVTVEVIQKILNDFHHKFHGLLKTSISGLGRKSYEISGLLEPPFEPKELYQYLRLHLGPNVRVMMLPVEPF